MSSNTGNNTASSSSGPTGSADSNATRRNSKRPKYVFKGIPNIIQFKEVVLTPTHLAIVMEYAAGGELFERICTAGKFSDDEGINCIPLSESSRSYAKLLLLCYINRATTRISLKMIREALGACMYPKAEEEGFQEEEDDDDSSDDR
ncbi:hypothetical protein ACFE04_019251 [Oxalis oulophora]